jgi:ABC-type nickel/cobalt efflux system permease component RcnA
MSQPLPPEDHRVKIPHLVFGLLFLGVAAVWALVAGEVITEDRLTVIIPALLIGAGVIGLAASLASTRNRRAHESADAATDHDHHDHHDHHADDHTDDRTQEIR